MDLIFKHFCVVLLVKAVLQAMTGWPALRSRMRERPQLAHGYQRLFIALLVCLSMPPAAMGVGVVSGQVGSTIDYLSPTDGNTVVLAW
jgi:hypothetical protein